MARSYTSSEAAEIGRWHLSLLSRLQAASATSLEANKTEIRAESNELTASGYYEKSFLRETIEGIIPTSDKAGISKLVTCIYRYRRLSKLTRTSVSLLNACQPEVERLLEELEPAYKGFTWNFLPARTKVAAESACARLKELMGSQYPTNATSVLDEMEMLHKVDPERAWADFLGDRIGYRRILMECLAESATAGRTSKVMEKPIKESEELGKSLACVKTASCSLIPGAKKAIEEMIAVRAAEMLGSTPIEDITRQKAGIRAKVLRDCGYETIGKLSGLSAEKIAIATGLGWRAASDVVSAVKALEGIAAKSARIRLSSDSKTPEATRLICALYDIAETRRIAGSVSDHERIVEQRLSVSEATLRKHSDISIWPFRDDGERQETVEAYASVNEILDSEDAAKVLHASVEIDAIKTYTGSMASKSKHAWSAFDENPIQFFNLLEEIAPNALGSEVDYLSGLPKRIVEEISSEAPATAGLKCELRRYQEWGVKYILHQGKVLLGDEMGLGKTIEAIASMVALKATGAKHFMVVCPAGVLPNWCREIVKNSDLEAVKVHGQDKFWDFASWINKGGVAVTTYETSGTLEYPEDLEIDMLVVDEAHYIKNPSAKRSRSVASLCERSPRVLFMTGTALENRVDEMLTLITYLNPAVAEEAAQYASFTAADAFKESVASVYYRRKREDVLTELPELIETEAWCTLTEEESRDYEYYALKRDRTSMRRVSWVTDEVKRSSKMKRLKEIIADAEDDGRRVIIFSFYLDTIWDIYEELGDRAMYPITGAIQPKQRQEIIDEFNEAPPGKVIISQIMAGGTGINIQAASVVVICEPQYKPSTENQAISRAYRMGQSRNVLVYRLLAEDTLDESVTVLLRQKQLEFDTFADKSIAGADSIGVNDSDIESLIEKEIERIKQKHGAGDASDDELLESLKGKGKKTATSERKVPAYKSPPPERTDKNPRVKPGTTSAENEGIEVERVPTIKTRKKKIRSKKKTFSFNVAGVVIRKTGRDWEMASASQVTVVREKNNKYDKNAVALHINGWRAGYVPRNLAGNVSSFLDAGYTARVTSLFTEEVPERKRYKSEYGGYYYEEDYSKTFHIVHMEIVLDEPGAAEKAAEEEKGRARRKKADEARKKLEASHKPVSEEEAKKLGKLLPKTLTKRQIEAFLLIAQGKTRAEASYAMGIKEGTFGDYTKAIYSMFNFHSKKELIMYARETLANGKPTKPKK